MLLLALGFNFTFYILPTALFFGLFRLCFGVCQVFELAKYVFQCDMILICFPHQHIDNYLVCDQILGSSRFYAFKTVKAAFKRILLG